MNSLIGVGHTAEYLCSVLLSVLLCASKISVRYYEYCYLFNIIYSFKILIFSFTNQSDCDNIKNSALFPNKDIFLSYFIHG